MTVVRRNRASSHELPWGRPSFCVVCPAAQQPLCCPQKSSRRAKKRRFSTTGFSLCLSCVTDFSLSALPSAVLPRLRAVPRGAKRFMEPSGFFCVVRWEGSIMRQTAFALFFGSLLAASLPAADQQLVNMVMPDAKVIAGVNVDSARNSPFGSFLLAQLPVSDPGFQKFVEASGFNPRADLQEILVATAGAPAPADPAAPALPTPKGAPASRLKGLILARGNFNVEKISILAKVDGKQNIKAYNGATLIFDPKDANATGAAFLGPNILVAGDLQLVKGAIDRRTQTNTLDPELIAKMNSLSASQDAWAVSIAPLTSLNTGASTDPMMQGALGGDIFKKVTETSGGIKFGALIQLTTELVALDEKNATALGDVVKFLVGMVSMNSGTPKGAPPVLMTILQSINIQTQGNIVSVTMSAPEDQVEGLIHSMQPDKKPGSII
jgi:hypothetical protein